MRSRKHAQTRPAPVAVALLMIDVLTTFEFPDGDAILRSALKISNALVRLKAGARDAGIPVLYVNDNFGDWRSEKEVLIGRCLQAKGTQFVRPLVPDGEDYFVLKPLHSAFYMTPLEVLLQHLQVRTLLLTGLTSNSCLTVTAHDANMRGYARVVDENMNRASRFSTCFTISATERPEEMSPPKASARPPRFRMVSTTYVASRTRSR